MSREIPLCLLLVGSIMAVPLAAGTDQRQDSGQRDPWLRIAAFTDIPLAAADVAVYSKGGHRLFRKQAATNNRGALAAHLNQLPEQFRVVVTWDPNQQGDLGRIMQGKFSLSANVTDFDPTHGIVHVNPVTTIVSRLLQRLPSLPQQQAEAMTRQFLGLSTNASLGVALRQGTAFHPAHFSQSAFLSEASRYGGIDSFIDALVTELLTQPAQTHAFPVASQSPPGGIASFIATNLAAGALKYVGGQGAGWIMAQTGLVTPGATTDNIAALQEGLANITSSIANLNDEVAELTQLVKATATQSQYVTITTTAQQYATEIQGHESDLNFWAQYCPPLVGDGATPAATDPYCSETNKSLLISELQTEYESKYYEEVQGFVQDNGTLGTSGIPHLYSLWLGESKPFFRPADSTKMQNLHDYWDTILTSAANLRMELFHYLNYQDPNSPAGNQKIIDFVGNPDLTPPTAGVFQVNETANLKLTFPAVPVGTVIDTNDRTMWATDYPLDNEQYCITDFGLPPPQESLWVSPITSPLAWNGISGWTSPSLSQMQSLIQGWNVATNPTYASPNSFLIAQTQAVGNDSPLSPGFTDVLPASPGYGCGGGGFVWTTTATGGHYTYDGHQYPEYYVMRLDNGTTNIPSGYSIAGLNSWNWIFLIRSLGQGEQYYWYQ